MIKKTITLIILVFTIIISSNAQHINSKDSIYTFVEQMPTFPGGTTAMMKYISDNLYIGTIPDSAGLKSRLVIRFVIDTTGCVVNPQIIRSIHPSLDSTHLRVVQSMPLWEPGRHNGKKVCTEFTLPIIICIR